MSFERDLDKAYKKKVIDLLEGVARKVAFDTDNDLVAQTPVDTGRARSNWIPSLGSPSSITVEAGNKPPIEPVISRYTLNDTIFITNNLPYIRRLNDGYSQQQPTPSWVDATVAKNSRKIKQVVQEVKRGL